ncbi:unnamed protein product [Prunus brigantina]
MLLNVDAARNLTNFVYDHHIARKELVDFIIRAELPFKFVESHDFKGSIQCAFCPQYKGISASTCKRDVLKKLDKERINLLAVFAQLDSKICLILMFGHHDRKWVICHLLHILSIKIGV